MSFQCRRKADEGASSESVLVRLSRAEDTAGAGPLAGVGGVGWRLARGQSGQKPVWPGVRSDRRCLPVWGRGAFLGSHSKNLGFSE